jgi:hypothetical protein
VQINDLAESLLLALTLQHVGVDLAVYVTHLKEGGDVDEAYGFLSELVLTRTSKLLFSLQNSIKEKWIRGPRFKASKVSSLKTK